jgi:AraC-like DNA-binding protein
MTSNVQLLFCTYFKKIEKFRYERETYGESVAFCVRRGAFSYRIGEGEEETLSEGELVICPPSASFQRRILEPTELCMIKFKADHLLPLCGKKIKASNILRWNEDLSKLKDCLFCGTLSENPHWAHYCMDIIYLAADSVHDGGGLGAVKRLLDQSWDKELRIAALAEQAGYTVPHLINKFKHDYGISPKAYLSQIKIQKAKELLLMSDLLSREVADALGFRDELYFIRFFKKHTGVTPRQFRQQSI